jgi:Protein of unknown function (DUF3140)
VAQRPKPVPPDSEEAGEVKREFRERVNMSPSQIERWLDTDESKSVGQASGSAGSTVGRDSGRRIIAIKRKKAADLSGADIAWMKKVNGYIARHLEQRPRKSRGELREADWTYSLKNCGHDPLRR